MKNLFISGKKDTTQIKNNMARIRTIKPEFWESESIASLSFEARLLFICCWNIADDSGRLRWNPTYLSGQAFAYDNLENDVVSKIMDELVNADLVVPYTAGEKVKTTYAYVKNWLKHQNINRPQAPKYPAPPDYKAPSIIMSDSLSDSVSDSVSDSLEEGKGGERNRKGREGIENPPNNFVVMSPEKLHEILLGSSFQNITCMNLKYDEDSFKSFTQNWVDEKIVTGDYLYPANRLKTFLLQDYKTSLSKKIAKNYDQAPSFERKINTPLV